MRVFALGSSGIAKTQERQPPYLSAKFVDWWNEHYDRIAGFEPAYDQLNQIVKWAYIIDWLDDRYSSARFLSDSSR